MFKADLRKVYKLKRSSLIDTEALSLEIANKTLDLDIWDFQNYHVFFPIEKHNEVDSKLIIQIIQGKDKNVILPKINVSTSSATKCKLRIRGYHYECFLHPLQIKKQRKS